MGNIWRGALASSVCAAAAGICSPAFAGPPFLTDDPDPTPQGQYEIYIFAAAEHARDGEGGDVGVDFNYGGGPHLQLTATLPVSWERRDGGDNESGVGNIELAAKYQVLHQEEFGLNVAVFPRVFLPSASDIGDDHAAFLLPIWAGYAGDTWSTFGGGGCAINRGGGSRDYCEAGVAYTHRFGDSFQLGAEVFHQSADTDDGDAVTTLGVGATYDVSERVHILGYAGDGMQSDAPSSLYTSILFTF